MASKASMTCISFPANADLSSSQYLFGVINASGKVAVAGDGVVADGVIQNDPAAADRAVTLAIAGRTKVKAGATITAGDLVASDASGQAVGPASGDIVLGKAVEGGASGDLISIIFQPTSVSGATTA